MRHEPLPPVISLRLLQTPALVDGAQAQTLQPLSAALLALLALRGPMARDVLAAWLYPGGGRERQLTNLRQRLRQVRDLNPALLMVGRHDVALSPVVRHDLLAPETALAADPEALPGPLLGTLEFHGATELSEWLRRERAAWSGRRREALIRLCLDHEAADRIALALRYATRLVADEPTHEHGVRLLMRLHYRRGDRGAALAAYELLVQALHEQFGDAVSDETAQLGHQIAQAEAPSTPALVPLPTPMPLALRHPPALVGRERWLQAAMSRWQTDGVALIGGPAGIGKTRVFEALCQRTATTAVVRLAADDGDIPLGLLRRLLQQLQIDTAPSATAHDLRQALAACLAAADAEHPLCLGIEDLHFADPESLASLVALLPRHGAAAVRWWLSSRDTPWPPALAHWLDTDDGARAAVVLPEWSVDDVAAFVTSVGGAGLDAAAWGRALHLHCGGRPLYLLWVLRAVHEQGLWGQTLPPGVLPRPLEMQARIARRLDSSDPLTQQVAFIGAIAGLDFDAMLVARVTGRRAAELAGPWRRLEALGVLHGATFSHELMRQAVLDAVPTALRPLLHADVAAALPDGDGVHERRGVHWQAAGELLAAAADFERAGDDALRMGLPTRALDLYERAEALQAQAGRSNAAFDLRWRAGRLAVLWATTDRALGHAEHLLVRAVGPRQRGLALVLRAQVRVERQHDGALADADEALALSQACGDTDLRRVALMRRAGALHVLGRWPEALALLDDVTAGVAGVPTEQDLGEIADQRLPVLAALGRRREAVTVALSSRDRALAAGHWQRASEAASHIGVQRCYLGELAGAIEASEQAVELCLRLGSDSGAVHVDQMTLAGLYADAGRFREAVALGETAADGLRAAGLTAWITNADNSLASMFTLLGRFDLAERRLPPLSADAPLWTRAARETLIGMLHFRRTGTSPLDHLLRGVALFEAGGAMGNPFVQHRIHAEVAAWSPIDEGLPRLDAAEDWARAMEQVSLWRTTRRIRIELLLTHGRLEEAAIAAEGLETDFGGVWEVVNGYLPDMWRTLARAWAAIDRVDRARAHVHRGCAWIEARLAGDVPPAFVDTFLSENRTNRWFQEQRAHHDLITVGP